MDAVFGLLLLLLGASHGWETFCDGQQDRAECFGPLGGTLNLRLMDNASKIFRYDLYRLPQSTVILSGRANIVVLNELENRSSFTPDNGTFKINNLNSSDGVEYKLEIYKDTSGAQPETRTLQLTVQVPVSSVQMVPHCLSQGEMRVLCISNGDSPRYSWTLDGRPLSKSQLLSDHGQNITLKQNVEGLLVCRVENQVSRVSEGRTISTCASHLLILCVQTAVFVLIIVSMFAYFAWKKKKIQKAEAAAGQQQEYENVSVVMVEMRGSASEL